jgi:hypothetical protein
MLNAVAQGLKVLFGHPQARDARSHRVYLDQSFVHQPSADDRQYSSAINTGHIFLCPCPRRLRPDAMGKGAAIDAMDRDGVQLVPALKATVRFDDGIQQTGH